MSFRDEETGERLRTTGVDDPRTERNLKRKRGQPDVLDVLRNTDSLSKRTKPCPSSSSSFCINNLPPEIVQHIARLLIADRGELPDAYSLSRRDDTLRGIASLRRTCSATLAAVSPAWQALVLLRWPHQPTVARFRSTRLRPFGHPSSWAEGDPLPTTGRTAWTVRIKFTKMDARDLLREERLICIGVADLSSRCAWALRPSDGRLRRWSRSPTGEIKGAPVPSGYPDGHMTQVLFGDDGKAASLCGDMDDAVIECVFDADAGTLSFGVKGRPVQTALGGFPRGQPLRPWARLMGRAILTIRPSLR